LLRPCARTRLVGRARPLPGGQRRTDLTNSRATPPRDYYIGRAFRLKAQTMAHVPPPARRPRRPASWYVERGREAIHALIEAEHAAVLPELEAKIAEAKWETLTTPIDPHHLSTARRHLVREHVILEDTRITRGGRAITVLVPADEARRRRKIEDAAKRKRLVHARYLSWAMGSASQPALLGPGGESVLGSS